MTQDPISNIGELLDAGAAIGAPHEVGTEQHETRPYVVVPKGYDLKSLEHLMPAPWRKRGTVSMRDQQSFCRYLADQGGDVSIYGLRATGSFVAILDSDTADYPGWRDHRAAFTAQQTPEWVTWTKKNGVRMTQTDFAAFVEDNLPDITDPVGAEMLEMCRLLEAKKKVEFVSGIRLSNGENELAYEESISGTVGKGKLPVPETFTIAIAPFEGSDRFAFQARLRYRIGDDKKLSMWFDLDRPHKVMEAAVTDIWNAIEGKTGLAIYNGMPANP